MTSSHPHPAPPPPSTEAEDEDITSWILEFVLRQPISKPLANALLSALPLSPPLSPRLQKSILLHRLAADLRLLSVTERTLETLETLETLDSSQPKALLREAHRAVAVECAALHLRRGRDSDFASAVDRIWRCRMMDLVRSDAAGLASGDWAEWRGLLDRAMYDESAKKIVSGPEIKHRAVDAVREYLLDTVKAMGPTFLEIMSDAVRRSGMSLEDFCERGRTTQLNGIDGVPSSVMGLRDFCERTSQRRGPDELGERAKSSKSCVNVEKFPLLGSSGTHFMHLERERATQLNGIGPMATNNSFDAMDEVRRTQLLGKGKHITGTMAIGQETSKQGDFSTINCDCVPISKVNKVREALKESCVDLKMVVEDPLPDAVITAIEALKNLQNTIIPKKTKRKNNLLDGNTPVSTAELQNGDHDAVRWPNRVNPDPPDPPQIIERDKNLVERNKHPNVSRPSLMDRNPTASTFEWDDDSIDSPSDSSPSHVKRIRLPSPKRMVASPLTLMDNKIFLRRRKRKLWSVLEEDTLRKAVNEHGAGSWTYIRRCYHEIFENRTEGDLKDKWRNMTRQ